MVPDNDIDCISVKHPVISNFAHLVRSYTPRLILDCVLLAPLPEVAGSTGVRLALGESALTSWLCISVLMSEKGPRIVFSRCYCLQVKDDQRGGGPYLAPAMLGLYPNTSWADEHVVFLRSRYRSRSEGALFPSCTRICACEG